MVRITYTDGTEATVDQMARDVTAFLVWTAEPELNQRHRSGLVVLGFLLIFTILAFMSYRAIWPTKRAIEASTERRPAMHDAASVLTKRLAAIDAAIRIIPDFPQPGIQFRDITPLIADPPRFADAVEMMTERARALAADAIVAVEARGFLFGAPLALALGLPLVPVRKPGKLPGETHMIAYGLEYGADRLELHVDALGAGHRAVIIDDLLATGGTVAAAADLVRRTGAAVAGAVFLVELADLDGARVLTRPVPDRSKRC